MISIYFIFSCILIIVIVILGSYAIVIQNNLNSCITNPAPYCYTDWKCLDPMNKNNEINMSDKTLFGKSGIIHTCQPLTVEQVKEFRYTDLNGIEQIRYPGTEINIWSLSCRKTTPDGCPFYKVGDIYWPACNGSPSSKYYTNPEYYNKLAEDSKIKKFEIK